MNRVKSMHREREREKEKKKETKDEKKTIYQVTASTVTPPPHSTDVTDILSNDPSHT